MTRVTDVSSPQHAPGRRPSAAVYRRRRLVVFGSSLLALCVAVFVGLVLGLPLPSATVDVTQPDTASGTPASVVLPPFGVTNIWADGYGTIVDTGGTAALPMASMTKVITALMVLKQHPLSGSDSGPTITFTQTDVDIIDEVIALNGNYSDVGPGDTTTERDALTAMLLKSANNIATSLAVWSYGSMDDYRAATSAWLAENGLVDTTVLDASGLDPGTVSTPADMVEIGRLAMADPVLASIVGTTQVEVPLFGKLTNGNALLGKFGINGIKTGTTDEAGSCLLFAATFSAGGTPVSLVGVTMGGPRTQAELQPVVEQLVGSTEAGFGPLMLTDATTPVATVTTPWHTSAGIVPQDSLSRVVFSDARATYSVALHDIRAGKKGDRVGTLSVSVNGEDLRTPLVLNGDLGDPGPGWRFSHVAQLFG